MRIPQKAFLFDSSMREAPVYPAMAGDANRSKHGELPISAVPEGVRIVLSIGYSR
jgi:hypothetical protein